MLRPLGAEKLVHGRGKRLTRGVVERLRLIWSNFRFKIQCLQSCWPAAQNMRAAALSGACWEVCVCVYSVCVCVCVCLGGWVGGYARVRASERACVRASERVRVSHLHVRHGGGAHCLWTE